MLATCEFLSGTFSITTEGDTPSAELVQENSGAHSFKISVYRVCKKTLQHCETPAGKKRFKADVPLEGSAI